MGHRTISLHLVWRALCLDRTAYDELRNDDNPFVEGLYLLIIIGAATAALTLIGNVLAWLSGPDMTAVKAVVLQNLQVYFRSQPWWENANASPNFWPEFTRYYDLGWQVFPVLLGSPNPATAALNILIWPLQLLARWLVFGTLAFMSARVLRGHGDYSHTLGVLALSFVPELLKGFGVVPFLAVGTVVSSWQILGRYQALRSVHGFSWKRAFWATVLPHCLYLLFWLLLAAGGLTLALTLSRR
jgi:hypothetical protein